MNSRIKAFPNQSDLRPARRRATRLAQAALLAGAVVGAVNCTDGQRVVGPLRPTGWPAKMVLDSAPAPMELKLAKKLPTLSAAPSASRAASTSPLMSAAAADPVGSLVATSIPFEYEKGPFDHPLSACEDCLLGEQDENGNATGNGLPIGFDFTFYGNTYKEFWLSTNGFLAFDRGTYDGCCTGGPIPSADEPSNMIAVAWTDLKYIDQSDFGKISYETRGTAPHRRLIVDFNEVSVWQNVDEKISAQVVLYEGTNVIEMHTRSNHATANNVTQGVENADGTAAAFIPGRVEATFDLDDDGVRFADGSPIPNNVPTVNPGGNAGGPPADHYEGLEGKAIKFSASAADADNDQLSYAWDFDGDGANDATGPEAEHIYPDNGKYAAKVTVSDGKGGVASATADVLVAGVPPTAELQGPESVDEGSPIVVNAQNISDPSTADQQAGFEFAFDCGAGAGFGAFSREPVVSCPTVDNGTRKVAMKIRDQNADESEYSRSVTIRNVAPVVNAGESISVMSGQVAKLSGRFSDVGVQDKMWDYSWSSAQQGVARGSQYKSGGSTAEQGAVPGEYKACSVGPQVLTLSVSDKDKDFGASSVTVNVLPLKVDMAIKPGRVAFRYNDNDEDSDDNDDNRYSDSYGRLVTVYVFSSANFDATTIDPASVRLTNGAGKGTALASQKTRKGDAWEMKVVDLNKDRVRDVKLRFRREAMIANGDLTRGTVTLTLFARAGTCAFVGATAPVVVKP